MAANRYTLVLTGHWSWRWQKSSDVNTMAKAVQKPRSYRMTVAGQLFKHLGLQMYSGAVPALAELISNAHDAMAGNVYVTLPADRPLAETDDIVVKDDGHGMTFDDANEMFLTVGRDRRGKGDEWTKAFNGHKPRKVQGRKGIGKLAGFGIADRIEVRSVKDGEISHFALDFAALTKSQSFADTAGYSPEPLEDDGKKTKEKQGTEIRLSRLKLARAINQDQFVRGIARRLLVLDDDFKVHVNTQKITRQEIPFQFRTPAKAAKWETAELSNGQQIQWWAGFSKETIPDEEQRGFVVYVRGKLAQTPWFFDLSGGVWGQHGMQYLTGEVRADFLDEAVDLIATDRGTVRWEDPAALPLRDWGQKKIRNLLEEWTDKRREAKAKSPRIAQFLKQAEKLPDAERKIFKTVVDRIVAIPQLDGDKQGRDIADELVEFVYNALTNRSVLEAIRALNGASATDIAQFNEILDEWDILEAVSTAHLVKGRVEIIRKFDEMIKGKVPEKPDMQDYLRDHPWLIDPKWSMLIHEQSLDKLLNEKFGTAKTSGKTSKANGTVKEGGRRLDFFCLGDKYQVAHVVEAKRPGALVGRKEFDQLRDYVLYLRTKIQKSSTNAEHSRSVVKGLLIADRVRPEDEAHAQEHQKAGTFDIRNWDNLLSSAETLHEDYLKVITARAPADDPRMQDLARSSKKTKKATKSRVKPGRLKKKKKR